MKLKTTFITVLLLLAVSQSSLALVIISPKNGDTFKEGDTVKIVAEISPESSEDRKIGYVSFSVTKGLDNCPDEIITHPRYECSFVIPPGSPRVIKIGAEGVTTDGTIDSPWVTIYISLPSTVILQKLKSFTGNRMFFSQLGENSQLYIVGAYSDGVERELQKSQTGTTYTSSNENVVTVNADGLATARTAGRASITVTNGDKKLLIDVIVEPKP